MSLAQPYDMADAKHRMKRVMECNHDQHSTTVFDGMRICDGCGGFEGYDL